MKKYYYSNEVIEIPVDEGEKSDLENERRKQFSIETNRRRREMALKVKKEIEKEEMRRREILKQRKEYQNSLNDKLHKRSAQRSSRITSVQHLTASDLDRTLSVLRSGVTSSSLKHKSQSSEDVTKYNNRLESAWSDSREVCPSPMIKYSGTDVASRHRNNDHYFKTFETRLLEQEQAFRQRQDTEMSKFTKVLDDTVTLGGADKKADTIVDERATYRVEQKMVDNIEEDVIECIEDIIDKEDDSDDYHVEDSLDTDAKVYNENKIHVVDPTKITINSTAKKENGTKKDDIGGDTLLFKEFASPKVNAMGDGSLISDARRPVLLSPPLLSTQTKVPFSLESSPQPFTQTTIKSILKKGLSNTFGSNPDIPGSERSVDIRDSVEIARTRSSKLFRSSSFSHGINDLQEKSSIEEDGTKKFVRFADDSPSAPPAVISQPPKVPCATDQGRGSSAPKTPKTFTVPGSTPLKPPLHPRSTQEGSYLQGTLKRNLVFQPPPRPRKINVETLDKQLDPILHPKKTPPISTTLSRDGGTERQDDTLLNISLDKTPTENEIEQLWAEVRECLSKSRTTSKPESVGLISGRTMDSGSDVSVRSAPSWQRTTGRGAPFQVRHHRPWSGRQTSYPGQETPIKNEVTVHSHNGLSPATVTLQPLNVLGQRDQDFQAVSESMEEFLSIEGTCNTPSYRRHNTTTVAATPTFLPRPPSQTRTRTQPIRWPLNTDAPVTSSDGRRYPEAQSRTPAHVPVTQLSLDEDKVKRSLDRLNDRLKNMTTFA